MADGTSQTPAGEGQHLDRKSLRTVTGKTADFAELAKDCVCFANGSGGQLLIGIEDDATAPPAGQRIPTGLLDRIRKRVGELTVNVDLAAEVRTGDGGGEYIVLTIARAVGVASTSGDVAAASVRAAEARLAPIVPAVELDDRDLALAGAGAEAVVDPERALVVDK